MNLGNAIIISSHIILLCHKINGIITNDRNIFSQSFIPQAPHCLRSVERCELLNSTQCLDITLPYKYTAQHESTYTINDIHNYLWRWKEFRSVPQCWKALQSVLCASFFPRCDEHNRVVSLPTHEMCRFTRGPCRLIEMHYVWPDFLRCDNETLFPSKCKNEYTDLKFNTSVVAKCSSPLVSTDDSSIWYPGIDGCALQCHNPIYTAEEHRRVSSFILHASAISSIATLFAVLTFIIDWRSSNRYPSVIIFYLNVCFLISNFGWLLQSFKGRDEIVCRSDNTSRYSEPGTPENFYCLLVFFLTYYFSIAALVWFVNLSYAWDLSFQRSSTLRESVNAKVAYFHLSAWSVPLMLTITILALGEIDGDSLRGICFVGFIKPVVRICFILIPVTISLIIGCFFLCKSMVTLIQVKIIANSQSTQLSSNRKRSKKIEHMIFRIVIFVISAISSVICTYICHIYEFTHTHRWKKSLDDYIICSLNMTAALYPDNGFNDNINCNVKERPNITFIYAQLIAFFGSGVITSTWVWTSPSITGWKRFILRHLKPDLNERIRLKRHEMISKVFNRRHQISQGCYSPSFHSMHDDPVGMNLTSAASQDLSTTWANALPNFVYRRGGITGQGNENHYLSHFSGTRQSSVSDISQQRSVDSYASQRRSLDSQMSLEQELAAIARHQRRKTKKERERMWKGKAHNHRVLPYYLPIRRGSDTSGSLKFSAIATRKFPETNDQETKSTSTGDLMALIPPQIGLPTQFVAPPLIAPSSTMTHHPPSSIPFVSPMIVPKQRPSKPSITNFTFTHGMSDQSKQLTNPLIDKRRPNSCAPNQSNEFTAQQITNGNINHQTNVNPFPNHSIAYMNGINYATPLPVTYFNPINPYYTSLLHNGAPNVPIQGFPNFIASPYPGTPIPGVPIPQQFPYSTMTPHYPISQYTNLQALQTIIREREAFLPLIAPVDSASETGEFFPIQLSDSEGFYTDAGGVISRNEYPQLTQQIVNERIQRVEAAAETNNNNEGSALNNHNNQTVVAVMGDGLVGDVLELKQLRKSEKKKKKKSVKRNHKKCNSSNSPVTIETVQQCTDSITAKNVTNGTQ